MKTTTTLTLSEINQALEEWLRRHRPQVLTPRAKIINASHEAHQTTLTIQTEES